MPTATDPVIDSRETSFSVPLATAQEAVESATSQLNTLSAFGQSASNALLVNLLRDTRLSLRGAVTGRRLAALAGYPSSPRDALAAWLADFEALCAPSQGDGWTVSDLPRRTGTFAGIVDGLSYEVVGGEAYTAAWTLSVIRGRSLAPAGSIPSPTVAPSDTLALADGGTSIDLGRLDRFAVERSREIDVSQTSGLSEQKNVVLPSSGVRRSFTADGARVGSAADLEVFRDDVDALVGGGANPVLQTAMPGYNAVVGISDFTVTATADETPEVLRYTLEATEGTTPSIDTGGS
jgi:hypothetical protein